MREEFAILLFFFGISATLNLALAVALFRAARHARRLEGKLLGTAPSDDPRMERLEQAMESLDVRVEHLARGQEFLSKLVSEKRRALSPRERVVTPHE